MAYEVRYLGADAQVMRSELLDARSEDEAVAIARARFDRAPDVSGVEVWYGPRIVFRSLRPPYPKLD